MCNAKLANGIQNYIWPPLQKVTSGNVYHRPQLLVQLIFLKKLQNTNLV